MTLEAGIGNVTTLMRNGSKEKASHLGSPPVSLTRAKQWRSPGLQLRKSEVYACSAHNLGSKASKQWA